MSSTKADKKMIRNKKHKKFWPEKKTNSVTDSGSCQQVGVFAGSQGSGARGKKWVGRPEIFWAKNPAYDKRVHPSGLTNCGT